jgi:cytochrome P450
VVTEVFRAPTEPTELGGYVFAPGTQLAASILLVQYDPELYPPDPERFRPERFLDEPPGTYTWIPFGGGRRRCLGASFAMLEMKVVLRSVFARAEPVPAPTALEGSRRRSITLSPRRGAVTVLRARTRAPAYAPAAGA